MWVEGASDLWGRLEEEGYPEEVELIEAVRDRLRRSGGPTQQEIDEWIAGAGPRSCLSGRPGA